MFFVKELKTTPDIEDMIYLMRLQKHDILNYLQVISGFIQLKKYEEAEGYLKQAMKQMLEEGQVLKLQNPDLVSVLIYYREQAISSGIPVKVLVDEGVAEEALDIQTASYKIAQTFKLLIELFSMRQDIQVELQLKSEFGARLIALTLIESDIQPDEINLLKEELQQLWGPVTFINDEKYITQISWHLSNYK